MSIEHELRLCNVSYQEAPGYPSFFVSRSLVKPDWTWTVYINGHLVDQSVPPITSIPPCSTGETAVVLQKINTLKICPGNPETRYVAVAENKKNKQFVSHSKAYIDSGFCVEFNGNSYPATVRSTNCHLLTEDKQCAECKGYHRNLSTLALRFEKMKRPSCVKSYKNYRSVILSMIPA